MAKCCNSINVYNVTLAHLRKEISTKVLPHTYAEKTITIHTQRNTFSVPSDTQPTTSTLHHLMEKHNLETHFPYQMKT